MSDPSAMASNNRVDKASLMGARMWLLFLKIIEQPVGGDVELVVVFVGVGVDLALDFRHLVGADVAAGFQRLEQMREARQFQLVGAAGRRRRAGGIRLGRLDRL